MALKFELKYRRQIVKTLIRLLIEQSDRSLHCLSFLRLYRLTIFQCNFNNILGNPLSCPNSKDIVNVKVLSIETERSE